MRNSEEDSALFVNFSGLDSRIKMGSGVSEGRIDSLPLINECIFLFQN